MRHRPVSVSRAVHAPPAAAFAILTDPRRHAEIDGSGTVRQPLEDTGTLELGSTFGMAMRQLGAPYRMVNEVTELEPDRRIAWRAYLRPGTAGGPTLGGVTWRYQLRPTEVGCLVTETYDITTGTLSPVLALLGFPGRFEKAMVRTLDRLAALVEPTG
jgi:uncharacterized protein YndB with AHSA1/START domain